MKVRVEYDNKILGKDIFWEGDSSKINEIRNIPARKAAETIVQNGIRSAHCGMWIISVVDN